MTKTIIVDIDGTLADIKHRRHFVERENKKKDFDSFHKACVDDKPINEIIKLVQLLYGNYGIHIFSGRSKLIKKETIAWLKKHNINYNKLIMREERDYTPDYELKKKWLDKYNKEDIAFVIDDRDRLVKMWREQGLTCLQCANGDF